MCLGLWRQPISMSSFQLVWFLQEFEGVANAEQRDIDIWHIDFETSKGSLLDSDSLPAALTVSKDKGEHPFYYAM